MTARTGTGHYRTGDRVWVWHDGGAFGSERVEFDVVRVNRVSLTVRNRFDEVFRLPLHRIEGRVE